MAETVFEREKNKKDNYTVLDNTFIRDSNLSLRAKGLMTYLLSLPDDWEIHLSELQNHATDGRDSLQKAIKDLEENGYLTKEQQRNEKGVFARNKYIIHEKPLTKEEVEEYKNKKESSKKQKKETPSTDNPLTDNPFTVEPLTVDQQLLNTNIQSTNKLNTNNTNSISSESKDSSEIPFPEPEDVEPKKIKRTRTTSKKTTDENSVSFSKESYKEVMDLYYDTRLSLNNQLTVTDEVYKYNIYTPLLKKYFELYGVEKCKLAIKNASTNEWVRNKTDFGLRTIFNDKLITKWIEDISVVTNKALRHDMFFNDPKHSHIDYENQDYSEEF